jgi:hypothetical protein
MVEMAEIFCCHGPPYRAKFGHKMLPSHKQVMRAIEQCRTPALGGHVYDCPECDETQYLYHSCRNRHCPKCQNGKGQQWLEKQQDLLLPVPYFLVTFTLPSGLRRVARSHQEMVYNLLFRTSAAAMQQLARDPRFVGGQMGMVPSTRALLGSCRRSDAGWADLAPDRKELFAPGEGALHHLSGQVP